jgi:hypothetical protein
MLAKRAYFSGGYIGYHLIQFVFVIGPTATTIITKYYKKQSTQVSQHTYRNYYPRCHFLVTPRP